MHRNKHPREMYLLSLSELCQRFTFWGVANLLILTLTGFYGLEITKATQIFALFTGASFVLPVVGGYISDRWNYRAALYLSCFLTAGGALLLGFGSFFLLLVGLALIACGSAFFIPSIYTLLGEVYFDKHKIREDGFSIYYCFINIGVFLAMLIMGYMVEIRYYRSMYVVASGVQILGLVPLFFALNSLKKCKFHKYPHAKKKKELEAPLHHYEFERMIVIAVLSLVSIIFWLSYNQTGSSILLLVKDFVAREVMGGIIPTGWYLAIEPLSLVILAVPFASFYLFLRRFRSRPNPMIKTAFSLVFLALAFLVLVRGTKPITIGSEYAYISSLFPLFAFILMAVAELLIAPIGLSIITHLSPRHYMGILAGFWYLCTGLGYYFGGALAGMITVVKISTFFNSFVVILISAAFILTIFAKKLNKMRHIDKR